MNFFYDKYCMDKRNVCTTWKCICENNENVIRGYVHVKS